MREEEQSRQDEARRLVEEIRSDLERVLQDRSLNSMTRETIAAVADRMDALHDLIRP